VHQGSKMSLMLGACSKNTRLVITLQYNTFSHFSRFFCASTWMGYLSHQSSKMTGVTRLVACGNGLRAHYTPIQDVILPPLSFRRVTVQQLEQFCAVAMYIILCKTHVMFCKEEQEEHGFHSCWAHILRTVGPVLTFAF
jgi:hypothetical protein